MGSVDHPGHDLGVKHRSALSHPTHGVGEPTEIGDPVLQEIADPFGADGQQLERIVRLEIVGQHQHSGLRPPPPDLHGGAQPVIGVAGRHADVHDRHVRLVRQHLAHQVLGVARLRDDVEAPLAQ